MGRRKESQTTKGQNKVRLENNENHSPLIPFIPLIAAVVAALGFIIVAMINRSTAIETTLKPIEFTQTAEARLTAIVMTTQAYLMLPSDTPIPSFTPTNTMTSTYTPTPSETPTITPTNEMKPMTQEYFAVSGDTLSGISRQFLESGLYGDAIGRANCVNILKVGDKLTIKYYVVQDGDYLGRIADRFSTTIQFLQFINDLNTEIIYSGQKIILPIYGKCE